MLEGDERFRMLLNRPSFNNYLLKVVLPDKVIYRHQHQYIDDAQFCMSAPLKFSDYIQWFQERLTLI